MTGGGREVHWKGEKEGEEGGREGEKEREVSGGEGVTERKRGRVGRCRDIEEGGGEGVREREGVESKEGEMVSRHKTYGSEVRPSGVSLEGLVSKKLS